jgi:hypothetical protein
MRANKNELTKVADTPSEMTVFEGVWGEMHVEYYIVKKRFDITPMLKGLQNDRCQVPHWGIVTNGRVTVKHEDGREEIVKAGDVYYIPPGHTAIFEAGTELWEFSPNDKIQKRGLYV